MSVALETFGGHQSALNYVWDVATLAPALMTQPGAASGGGDASAANQVTGNASLASIDGKTPALGQQLAAASSPVVLTAAQITTLTPPAAITGFATETTLGLRLSESDFDTKAGALTETAPASDTASSGLNGRLQRIAQRLTSLIALLPTALGAGGGLKVDGSGTALPVTANAGTNLNTSALALSATQTDRTQKSQITDGTRDGTVKAASTAAVATDTSVVVALSPNSPIPTGANVIGALTANQAVNAAQFGGTNVSTGTGAGGAGIPRVTVSNDSNVLVTPPTLTKGTQGATGVSTQDLKDAGRVNIMWTAEFSPAAVAEALLTVTESRDGAATTTFTTQVVTSGKRLRITSIDMVVENTLGANPKRAKLRLRFNTAGAVTTGSPLQGSWAASVATAVNTIGTTMFADFPDGIEYLGNGTKQIGWTLEFPDWVTAAQTGKVYITVFAFEY